VNIPSNIITLIAGILLTLISLWYGQNHGLMPVAASEGATQIDNIFNLMMTIATGLFLLVEGILIYCVLKFRRRKGDETDGPPLEGNVPLEIVWTAIPTVIVFVLAIYSFEIYNNLGGLDPMTSHDMGPKIAREETLTEGTEIALDPNHANMALGIGPAEENPLVVNVNGIQYAWIFTYPDTGIVSGELNVPIGRPVQLNISAGDVIHAFWVPQLRLKQDAIPGRDSTIVFTANREGDYPIICAELCGAYHGGMKTTLHVQTEAEYDQWVQENTLAQKDNLNETVAVNPVALSDGQFLAPYAQEMGVEAETIAQLQSLFQQHHSSAH
jgi:cytochrome c oxidase subunit 2